MKRLVMRPQRLFTPWRKLNGIPCGHLSQARTPIRNVRSFSGSIDEELQRLGMTNPLTSCLLHELVVELDKKKIDGEFVDLKEEVEKRFSILECDGIETPHERITVEFSCQGDHPIPAGEKQAKDSSLENYAVDREQQLRDLEGMGIYFTVEIARKTHSPSSVTIPQAITKPSRPYTAEEAVKMDRLYFSCVAGQDICILNIQFLPSKTTEMDKTLYGGANRKAIIHGGHKRKDRSSHMEAWLKYLADRGVDNIFSNFVLAMAIEKEAKEYSVWLEDIHGFVS